jgi:dehydrogenase/reductase SDR family protein 12
MSEVETVAEQLAAALPQVDVLINNVGLMLAERVQSPEGLEQSFATNVLGHYVLTEALRTHGRLSEGLIINMSSGGMYNVPMTLDRLQGGERYDGMLTYAYQKRAQVLLNSWWRAQGLNSYVMHPGWVDTPGVETAMPDFYNMTKAVLRDSEAGADTALWLAAAKPEQTSRHGIWFDRRLRGEHVFADTRAGADAPALVEYLDRTLSQVMDQSRAEVPESSAA